MHRLISSIIIFLLPLFASAKETQLLSVSGSFAEVSGYGSQPAKAFYNMQIPCRGFFRGVANGTPALFGGPDGNNPNYHFSTQVTRVGDQILGNWTSTDIEVAPVITQRSGLVEAGGTYAVKVLGPQRISFTWGDFIGGDAQNYTAQGFFDPSPEANAGPNRIVQAGTASSLQGAGTDRDGDTLTYSWTRIFGPDLGLSSASAAQPAFTAPSLSQAATTRMQLIVSDAHSQSLPDLVDVIVYPQGGNIPPVVQVARGGEGSYNTQNHLLGFASYDPDGAIKYFSWTPISGPRVALSDPAAADPTFKQYEPAQGDVRYEFELIVSDGKDFSAPDTSIFYIEGYHQKAVPVGPRENQIFSGSGSVPAVIQGSSKPPATYDFTGIAAPGAGRLRFEVQGTPALFGGPDSNNPNFHLSSHATLWNGISPDQGLHQTNIEVAPVITNRWMTINSGASGSLRLSGPQALSYTFMDFLYGEAQSFNVKVWYRAKGSAPVANAGTYLNGKSLEVLQLDGTGSSDPDGDPLSYRWSQIAGPSAQISNIASAVPLVKLPAVPTATTLRFSLMVSDGVESAPSEVQIQVSPAPASTPTPTATRTPSITPTPTRTPVPLGVQNWTSY